MPSMLKNGNNAGIHITSRGPYIATYTARKFHPLDIRKSDIDLHDIAHALSNMCRFGGHCREFYSVAQHSILVAKILPKKLKLQGLLHDASEAYLVDVPRPIKKLADFSEYRRIEKETQRVIYKKYGIKTPDSDEIHEADNLLLATEARDLMNNPFWAKYMPKCDFKITPWSPKFAEQTFLFKFRYYNQ